MSAGRPTGPMPKNPAVVGLPPRPFMYTLDQVSTLLDISENRLARFLWYENREVGTQKRDTLKTVNIAPKDERPEWRVSEQELVRWMRVKGFKYYERGWIN